MFVVLCMINPLVVDLIQIGNIVRTVGEILI